MASPMHTLCYCASSTKADISPSLYLLLHPLLMADQEFSRRPILPTYTEMIFAAINDLKEKEGSSESSISNYIETTCEYLSDEHAEILTDVLNKLVDSGELVVLNNKYMRPDPTAPLKRGRGRPSKPKDPAVLETPNPAQTGSEIKRGRGRPKKDPNAPPAPKKVKAEAVPAAPSKNGRPRGRPRKVQPEFAGVEAN